MFTSQPTTTHDLSGSEPSYHKYCATVKLHYQLHISIDIFLLIVLSLFGIYFLHAFIKHSKFARKCNKKITKLHKHVLLCTSVLLCYIISMGLKLTNHILCDVAPAYSTATGPSFLLLHSISLAGILVVFSFRLKQAIGGTVYDQGQILYLILICSVILFIFIGILSVILFWFANKIGVKTAVTGYSIVASLLFFLYIIIISTTVTMFVSTLKKVKL